MTPRERVLHTINRQPVDRTPVDIWHTPEVLDSLKKHTGLDDDMDVYRKLGLDKIVWAFPGYGKSDSFFDPNASDGVNVWGVPVKKVTSGSATYYENHTPPLADFTEIPQLNDFPLWPDPAKYDYAGAKKAAQRAREFDFAVIGPWISHFEIYCSMRGLENAFMDVIAEPEFLDAGLTRIHDIQTAMLERYLAEMGDLVDIVFISDDMGSQESLLISLNAWDQFLHKRVADWCKLIHSHGKKVLFHTDGAAHDIVPRLIDCGVDILNPIQHVCPGMEMKRLKQEFGDKLIFHGGVENQSTIPFGTPADVEKETLDCLESLGAGGGFIACSCHNIQAGTPVQNILTLIETVHRHGSGVLRQ